MLAFTGRARVLGDAINTDYIISSSRKRETIDPHRLKEWLLESVDPEFAESVTPGDIIVAGERFGTGSAMEVAVTVVLAAGIEVVLAKSFSRTYFRNALNNGLAPVEVDTSAFAEGDEIRVEIDADGTRVSCSARQVAVDGAPLPDFAAHMLGAGGIVGLLATHGSLRAAE